MKMLVLSFAVLLTMISVALRGPFPTSEIYPGSSMEVAVIGCVSILRLLDEKTAPLGTLVAQQIAEV